MTVTPAETPEWVGPHRFLPPPEPRVEANGSKRFEGVTYAIAPGYRPLQLDVWVPESATPPPLVVWIHGGGWMFGDRRYLPETLRPNQLFEASTAAGLAIATIDYRHALEAQFPAQLHDAKAAIRYLRAHVDAFGVDATKVGVWGESAGGHIAALVGLTGQHTELEGAIGVLHESSSVDAVVAWYAPADFRLQPRDRRSRETMANRPPEMLTPPEELLAGGNDERTLTFASPISYVTSAAAPFLLIHGSVDTVVPYAQSEVLAKALTDAGVRVQLVPIEGAEHIFSGHDDVDGLVRLSVDYLASALRPAGP